MLSLIKLGKGAATEVSCDQYFQVTNSESNSVNRDGDFEQESTLSAQPMENH